MLHSPVYGLRLLCHFQSFFNFPLFTLESHLTISTLVAHSICRSFHITSSQSKSKKMTTTAGTSFWCFFNHPVFKMPLGMYHSYEVLWKWNPYTYFRVCVCVCVRAFHRLIGVCFSTICKKFTLPSRYSQSGNLLQKKPCKVHQFLLFPFIFRYFETSARHFQFSQVVQITFTTKCHDDMRKYASGMWCMGTEL